MQWRKAVYLSKKFTAYRFDYTLNQQGKIKGRVLYFVDVKGDVRKHYRANIKEKINELLVGVDKEKQLELMDWDAV